MANQRHLDKAPIVEALIDFRVKLPPSFQVTAFAPLKEVLKDRYPQVEEFRVFEAGVMITKGKRVQQMVEDKGLQGYHFKSADGKNVAQFRQDGFTFSRLKPYTRWEDVLAEAKGLWKSYVDTASPELISRIAVRYINQFDLPLPIVHLEHYLTAPPAIPQDLPQELRHFLTKVTICDKDLDVTAQIIQAMEKGAKPDHVTIILDIDVFTQRESGFEEAEMWKKFEGMRNLKNTIFFTSVTERTARLFE